ncbi:MAG: rRNA pseudouridine synthase [Ktedonobacteraceae bacterium]|nr:rRNA pseudouridine synthase [Ktedonobacteraceae bacterium]MBV9711400.1 rRNA pseudouridine synthase [Ktedonobacteraceae bacterium]
MTEKESAAQQQGERLSRFLAHAGIASRRHAEELIASGRVRVNDTIITTQGVRIDPARDRVSVDGKIVQAAVQHVYLLLNKPAGYVSTAHDPQERPTVLNLLPQELRRLRVYPIGRLDIDTEGLLLLTNDGDFALHLAHPRYSTDKHYEVLVRGYPSAATLAALRAGVLFTEDDGAQHKSAPAQVRVLRQVGSNAWLSLTIHEGRKRQVRRMLTAVGHPVLRLLRVGVGSLRLGNLPVGKWRYLTDEEVNMLWGKS